MRRIISLLAVLLLCGSVNAQVPMTGAGLAVPATGGGGNVNWTFQAAPTPVSLPASPTTFSGVSIGTAAGNRQVAVCAGETNNGPITAIDDGIPSITFTKAADGNAAGVGASLWLANVPAGTTMNIRVTSTSGFPNTLGIAVGTFNSSTPTPNSTATELAGQFLGDPQVTTTGLTVLTNGVGVACVSINNFVGTPTWNTGTADSNTSLSTTYQLLLAHLNSSGTPSVSGYASKDVSIAAASWGP